MYFVLFVLKLVCSKYVSRQFPNCDHHCSYKLYVNNFKCCFPFFFQDLPSFTQNIQQLVNDLRCYQLCNASLPAGSVKL